MKPAPLPSPAPRRSVRLVAASLLLAALGGGLAQGDAEELQADQRYPGLASVQSSSVGVSFTIPAGWVGKFGQDAKSQVLVLGSNTTEGVGLAILQTDQTVGGLAAMLNQAQDLGAGVVLSPSGSARVEGSRVMNRYQNVQYVGWALGEVGQARNSVVFFLAGPLKNEATYVQLLKDLAASTRFFDVVATAQSRPAVSGSEGQAWAGILSGQALHYFSTYNSGGASGGMSAHRILHLCSDGRFVYSGDSSITMNVPGANASRGGRSQLNGRWQIEPSTETRATLILDVAGGSPLRWPLRYEGGKLFLNGQRWLREASKTCS